jgi:Tol biopolymer transport system component
VTQSATGVSPYSRFHLVFLTLGVLGFLVVIVAGFSWWRHARAKNTPRRFSQFSYKQLTNNGIVYNATLAPDGKFFAFVMVQKEKESLRVGQTNSSEQIELRPPAEVSYEGLKFSSDGGTLFYAFADRNSIKFDLYKIAALGGVPVRLRNNIGSSFSISHDQKRLAFVREDAERGTSSILISGLDGSNESAIAILPIGRAVSRRSVSWSPDGAMLTFAASDGQSDSLHALYVADVSSKEVTALPPRWRAIDSVAWLKDGSGLAITARGANQQDTNQLWFVAYPAGEVSPITKDLATYNTVWASATMSIIFCSSGCNSLIISG